MNMAVQKMGESSPELVAGIESVSVNIPGFETGTDLETVKSSLEQYKQELLAAAGIPGAMQANVSAMESQLQQERRLWRLPSRK